MYPDDERGPSPPVPGPLPERPALVFRAIAILEVLLCSDYPTQFALAATFAAIGYGPMGDEGHLRVGYVVALSILDTAMLTGLIVLFLRAHGEQPREVLFGSGRFWREAAAGIPLIFAAFAIAAAVLLSIQRLAPSLHTVEHNPFEELIRTPAHAVAFATVVVVAGGIREELQRAFLLHRFDIWLGGGTTGIIVTSVAFGAGHFQLQGADAAIATGLLGAFWGTIYLRRRSALAPMVSHAGFDLLQIVQYFIIGR
jgi:membrane protease YdiL (CAAX protease family)